MSHNKLPAQTTYTAMLYMHLLTRQLEVTYVNIGHFNPIKQSTTVVIFGMTTGWVNLLLFGEKFLADLYIHEF